MDNSCSLCCEEFDRDAHEPRKVPCCFKTFCCECLDRWVSSSGTISCPNCRSEHDVKTLGVFAFPVDSAILRELDRENAPSPLGSINVSSDFIETSRPPTSRSLHSRISNNLQRRNAPTSNYRQVHQNNQSRPASNRTTRQLNVNSEFGQNVPSIARNTHNGASFEQNQPVIPPVPNQNFQHQNLGHQTFPPAPPNHVFGTHSFQPQPPQQDLWHQPFPLHPNCFGQQPFLEPPSNHAFGQHQFQQSHHSVSVNQTGQSFNISQNQNNILQSVHGNFNGGWNGPNQWSNHHYNWIPMNQHGPTQTTFIQNGDNGQHMTINTPTGCIELHQNNGGQSISIVHI